MDYRRPSLAPILQGTPSRSDCLSPAAEKSPQIASRMPRLSFKRQYQLLSVFDSAIALCVVFPFACMYWRGAWDVIGHYVLNGNTPLQLWVHAGVGQLQMVGLLCLPILDKHLDRSKKVKFWILTRLFMYLHTLTYMFYWHGLWKLLNYYFGTDWQYSMVTLFICWIALMVLGSCRSTMWPPFFISVDGQPEFLKATTRFHAKVSDGYWKNYATDAYFSQIIILGIAIGCWRSMFNVYDELLLPGKKFESDVASALAGIGGSVILLSLQVPLGEVSKRLARRGQRALKLLWEDVMYAVTFIALSMLWRGVWNLSEAYFIPQMPLGAWVNLALGSTGLIGMQIFTEVSAFGIEEDGMDPEGEAFYPVQYLRIFLKDYLESQEKLSMPNEMDQSKAVYENAAFSSKDETVGIPA